MDRLGAIMNTTIACPMCGHRFAPHQQGVCSQCPLNSNCRVLACCPRCGYEVINPDGSLIARWLNRKFTGLFHRRGASQPAQIAPSTLATCPQNAEMRVQGFADGFSRQRRAHLEAYGVDEGAVVRVLQHKPVTVLQVDNLEVALERELAGQILVEPAEGVQDN